jgi:hypothetical protein
MNFSKLDLKVDPLPLQRALKINSHLFGEFDMRAQGDSPHREMTDIWVRFNDIRPYLQKGSMEGFTDKHLSVWYPAYYELPETKKLIFDVMEAVEGEQLGGVLITKLPPGGKIYPHSDDGWHAAYYNKYYIPIENYEGATFNFEDGTIKPKLGEVYQFDNTQKHWCMNESIGDRIAMVVCVRHEGQPRYEETK